MREKLFVRTLAIEPERFLQLTGQNESVLPAGLVPLAAGKLSGFVWWAYTNADVQLKEIKTADINIKSLYARLSCRTEGGGNFSSLGTGKKQSQEVASKKNAPGYRLF